MKKRRPSTGNQTRKSKNSPRAGLYSATSDTLPLRSKSFQDLKRRRLSGANTDRLIRRSREDNESLKSAALKKKDAFGSLESLFDVKRPLKLPDLPRYSIHRQTVDYSSSESNTNVDWESQLVDLYDKLSYAEQEPDIPVESWKPREIRNKSELSKLEELECDIIEESDHHHQQDWDLDEGSPSESLSYEDMGDDIAEQRTSVVSQPEGNPPVMTEEKRHTELSVHVEGHPLEQSGDGLLAGGETNADDVPKPPDYPLPPGAGEGIPVNVGGHSDSVMSTTPLTDSEVIKEMAQAQERLKNVDQEIKETREKIYELKHKENLSKDDTRKLQETQDSLLVKLSELDDITRKLSRAVGLSDPSSRTFAKMFEMLPYPHTGSEIAEQDETDIKEKEAKMREDETTIGGEAKVLSGDDLFEIPQPEYSEDNLPRAIICGATEDKIPKIVIPDSRPKGTRCLKKLTGKLSESLNMQEKLVQENAKLEGGRYKLEEALLEKDNTLDSLQRTVCGLQAEMRIVVKENTELNRQLNTLSNGRRSAAGNSGCRCTTSTNNSPRSTNRQRSGSYSYGSSPRRDESSHCGHSLWEQSDLETRQASTICVNPESLNPYSKSCTTSPRLSAGGSRDDGFSYPGSTCGQRSPVRMGCRAPPTVKVPGPAGRSCPVAAAEMENHPMNYGTNTKQLAQQLDSMESEVRNMQMELANVHRERQQLEQQRKLLKCTGPCAPCSCCPPGLPQSSGTSAHQPTLVPCVAGAALLSAVQQPIASMAEAAAMSFCAPGQQQAKMTHQQDVQSCSGICVNAPMGASTCPQQQLRDLREQYARLQEDYRNKLCEVSCMRTEADKMKQDAREAKEEREKAENRLSDVQERMRSFQSDKSRFYGSKEQMMEQEQSLVVAKQRYREAQDELEELRSLIQDQANQLEDYRNKYLQAQEQVEEQRRQLDLMEMDNARMNENVNLEIGRVKNQFKEKLAELAPLPDILKQTQAKLQEVQQMRLIAERNCEDLSRELITCKDKLNTFSSQLVAMRSENSTLHDERGQGSGRCDELEKKNSELKNENERIKGTIGRLEEQETQLQQRIDEKTHEVVQLTAMLEEVREDSARQVARTKERCETVRRTMQGQIAEMEKQLAQCRATARAAQKDRDEIRQKMQGQINNLMEAFEQAQGRIRSLQGHVNYLKTSYSNIFNPVGQGESTVGYMPTETAGQGYDSCDCNY